MSAEIDAKVMARLRAPFGFELVTNRIAGDPRWRIHDANDDAIASVSYKEEGYARLIVDALNERAARLEAQARCTCDRGPVLEHETRCASRKIGAAQ
jgi:hypothetical protein